MKRFILRGFTLVELLVVISIITILAGLTVSTVGYAQRKAARDRARAEVSALEVALESYKIDNGDYPRDTTTDTLLDAKAFDAKANPTPTDVVKNASLVMYKELSGLDIYGQRSKDSNGNNNKIYFTFKGSMLLPNLPSGAARTGANQVVAVADPFKQAYGYSTKYLADTQTSGSAAANPGGYNPTFDLWSFGDPQSPMKSGTSSADSASIKSNCWITNW